MLIKNMIKKKIKTKFKGLSLFILKFFAKLLALVSLSYFLIKLAKKFIYKLFKLNNLVLLQKII